MHEIVLPGSALTCSRLGFGTASLHHLLRSRDRQTLLATALDLGFTHFDTARMYGEGMAERELGRFLVGQRQRVTIATKFGLPAISLLDRVPSLLYAQRMLGGVGRRLLPNLWNRRPRVISPEAAEVSLTRSLRALRTDWVDILFLHEPLGTEVDSVLRLAEWLLRQTASGRVRYLGLAGNAPDCVAIADQTDGIFDILQVEDSLRGHEADVVVASGRPMQVTFGYLRNATNGPARPDGVSVIQAALQRNRNGLVLVSSRRPERLAELALLTDVNDVSQGGS